MNQAKEVLKTDETEVKEGHHDGGAFRHNLANLSNELQSRKV